MANSSDKNWQNLSYDSVFIKKPQRNDISKFTKEKRGKA